MKKKPNIAWHMMDVKDIKPNPKNPRVIRDAKFRKLVQSLKDAPWMIQIRPIVIDENNIVIAGNQRLKAAIELKWKQVPVVNANHLTKGQKEELIVKDNVGSGEWDFDLLRDWDQDKLSDWGIDIPVMMDVKPSKKKDITGFYKKTHVLISFDPSIFPKVISHLEKIKAIAGVEYEQATN